MRAGTDLAGCGGLWTMVDLGEALSHAQTPRNAPRYRPSPQCNRPNLNWSTPRPESSAQRAGQRPTAPSCQRHAFGVTSGAFLGVVP